MDSLSGTEQWNAMSAWANANLTAAEHDAFNKAMDQGLDSGKLALAGLKSKYEASNGRQPNLAKGGANGGSEGEQAFASRVTAMKD
jgi:hypothetical protein